MSWWSADDGHEDVAGFGRIVHRQFGMIVQLHQEFETMLAAVTGSVAATSTADAIDRVLFR